MGAHDGLNDRQTKPGATAKSGSARVRPIEALEHVVGDVSGHPRSVVGDGDDRSLGAPGIDLDVDGHLGGCSLGCVRADVAQKVVEDLAKGERVGLDLEGARGAEGNGPVRSDREGGLDGFSAEGDDIHRGGLEGTTLVEAGQQEQIGHQVLHASGFYGDARHESLEVRFVVRCATAEEFGIGSHGGNRGAELVGRIGHKAAQAGVRSQETLLRSDSGSEGALDLGEHDVERPSQAADLGGRVFTGDAFGEVASGDRLGCDFDVS